MGLKIKNRCIIKIVTEVLTISQFKGVKDKSG